MGCNESISNDTFEYVINEQIQQIKSDTISLLSYQIFLNNFYFVSRYNKFYTELPLDKQLLIIEQVGALNKNECIIVVENFCKNADCEENLVSTLLQVSRKMVCKTKLKGYDEEVCIPISLSQELWKSIICKKYQTSFGKFKMNPKEINWDDNEIAASRDVFVNESQNEIQQVLHSKDLSLLISSNPIHNLWQKETNQEEISSDIRQNVSKPFRWEPSIHHAAYKGKKSSVEYNLSLLPQILNLADDKNNTPVHYAALGNQKNMLIYLRDIGANFKLPNSDGFLPIHLISKKSVAATMNELGVNINERNADGETLLDIKTREFDKTMIKTMIALGVNILEPNPDGSFWIQKTMHNEYYKSSMDEKKFINFVRTQLINNKKGIWNYNPIYEQIIQRKDKTHVEEDIADLNESVLKQDIPRISVLLAIGTKADEKLKTGETNLYLCSKRGLTNSARILAQNFCDTNFTNSQHENTFWVAAINEHFDTALVLRDCGANMDIIDANNETLMHNVYRRKITKIFDFILEAGASPNVKNGKCQTVTYIAFLNRDDEVAEMLQDKYKGDINAQDHQMNSLVHHAFNQGDLQRIEYLANRHINMNLRNNKGHSVLMEAFFAEINFKTWKFLIDLGSDVSTTDYKNNTLLHFHFMKPDARDDVFRFLMDNKIDYNIENRDGQFPISIAMKHDEAGFELLDLNCNILDQKSIHEPIVEALNRKSQKWVEALFNHGADAMNECAGVISRYINSGFFKYEIFKNIPRMNIFLEAPLQMAIYKKFMKCATYIWNLANPKQKKQLSYNADCYGRIPLSAAIMMKNETFVSHLLVKKYDCQTPDNDGKTPFIHAFQANVLSWMSDLFEIIPLKNANYIDNNKCSALTYAADNGQKDFCDYLFINDIEVSGMKTDSNGIIAHYRNLMDRYNRALKSAKKKYDDASNVCKDLSDRLYRVERQINELASEINSLNSQIASYNNSEYQLGIERWALESKKDKLFSKSYSLRDQYDSISKELERARDVSSYYYERHDALLKVTRKDILYNISAIEKLGKRDRTI